MDAKRDKKIREMTMTALMAAVIFLITWLIRIPMPVAAGGYLNIGDASVYIAAALLGGPGGLIAAAVGSALADLSAGYVVYALPTAVIKGLMGFVGGRLMEQISFKRFLFASFIGGVIMVGGYVAFETMLGGLNMALASAPFNMIQWICGVAVAAVFYPVVPRIKSELRL